MVEENSIFLGSITKTHGIAGELLVRSPATSFSFNDTWEVVFIEIDNILVPFFIESFYQPDNHTIILNIRDINDKNTASRYLGNKLYLHKSAIHQSHGSSSDEGLISYKVVDKEKGELGTILEHISIKENPLFLVSDGRDKFYIPASKGLITRIDRDQKQVFVSLPEGLLESQK